MKKIWVYLLGVLTGIVITIVALLVIGLAMNSNENGNSGVRHLTGTTFFEEPGDVIEPSSVKVFQALTPGYALAESKGDYKYDKYYGDPAVLLYDEEGTPYYDDQIVNAPTGKCFRQVGVYKYETKLGMKTVPIVMMLDK